jgi:uncharacterized protein (DUF1330 family)
VAAYIVAELTEISDPAAFDQYRDQVIPLVERYGGKYLAVTDQAEALEGDWTPHPLLVLIQFESMERLQEWYNSSDYEPLKELRHRCATTNVVAAEATLYSTS